MYRNCEYLRPDVVVEPLYQSWFAWPHLVSPATAAMNVRNRHLRVMDSYLKSPRIHERFAADSTMLGSPFMAHPSARLNDVRELRERTVREYAHIIALADALTQVGSLLRTSAHGYSLDSLYPQVPEILRGYIELSYDLENHPRFRVIEPLLYRSRYYDESAQSVALYLAQPDGRPFVLSTPRLRDERVLEIGVPFAHEGLDALFRMRRDPGSKELVAEMLGIGAESRDLFESLFTDKAPQSRSAQSASRVRVRYFGHACLLVECDAVSLLVDPAVTASGDGDVQRFTFADLPDHIDYVLITHNHQDHVLFDTLLQIRHKIGHLIVPAGSGGSLEDPSLKLMFEAIGFDNVLQVLELETIRLQGCHVTGVPFLGEHADLDIRGKLGYHVRLDDGYTVLVMADSCNVEPRLYSHVHAALGDVDMLFLGMECDGAPLSWLYGPLLPGPLPKDMDHSRRLNGSDYDRGMALVKQFQPTEVYVYAMGQEPWLRHIMALEYTPQSRPILASNDLVDDCRAHGIVAERLFGREILERGA